LGAHVLRRDALTVLQARHADLAGRNAGHVGQPRGGFHRRELLLRDAVDAVAPALLQVAFVEQLAHEEVLRLLLELHGARNFASCLRTRARSRGTSDSTRTRPLSTWVAP